MVRQPDRVLLTYLAPYDPHVSALALGLREVVLEEAPDAIEAYSKGYAVGIAFSFTGKPMKDGFCYVATYSSYVNLGFNRGALLPDPNKVLAGTGKLNRHITIRTESDLHRPYIRRYIQAAMEQAPRPEAGHVTKAAASKTAARSKAARTRAREFKSH